jgi:hypothetical protein
MEYADDPGAEVSSHSGRSLWRDWRFWIQLLVVLVLTWLGYWVVYRLGVAHDCAALGVKQDGQCGEATAMGEMFGVLIGLSVLVAGGVTVAFLRYRRNRRSG